MVSVGVSGLVHMQSCGNAYRPQSESNFKVKEPHTHLGIVSWAMMNEYNDGVGSNGSYTCHV